MTLFSAGVGCAATPQAAVTQKSVSTPKSESSSAKPSNDAIVEAIASGKFDEVKSLKARGVSVDAISSEGLTGLMKLAEEGDSDSVRRLLDLGAKLDVKNAKGETALWYAVYGGHEDLALDLISKGAKVDGVVGESKDCLIHVAAKSQLTKLADVLKTKTPNCLAMKNSDGSTPAEIARSFGDEALAKKLTPRKK
jgi:ankyrin repeat protein